MNLGLVEYSGESKITGPGPPMPERARARGEAVKTELTESRYGPGTLLSNAVTLLSSVTTLLSNVTTLLSNVTGP